MFTPQYTAMSKRSSVDVGAGGVQANSSPQNNASNTTSGSTSGQVIDNEDRKKISSQMQVITLVAIGLLGE